MPKIKMIAACLAATALLGVSASPASALRDPEGPGQPVFSGGERHTVVIHCQKFIEQQTGLDLPPGTFPGNIILTTQPELTFKDVSPGVHHCPLADFLGI
jgi:hypothetical protein